MIKARFQKSRGRLCGFSVSGHSGYADAGADIVCASVSSAVMLTANALTEVFKVNDTEVDAEDNTVSVMIGESRDGQMLIEALLIHLRALSEEYPENISVKISEV